MQAASGSPSAAEITARLTAEVKRHPTIKLAILYGSYARGTQRSDSDIDLAVAADHRAPLSEETLIDVSVAASLQTGREVQVRDLARAQGLFLKEVLTTGVVIYQTDPAIRGRLISRMLGFVEDFQPIASLPDTELLDTKIESLEHCVHRIESHIPSSASELEADYDRQDIISVNLQRAIQICVDLGGHLISKQGWHTPLTMAETFQTLADHEVLSGELAGDLQRAVGFRNISVHEYDKIDWHRVYRMVTDRLELFRQFAREIVAAWPDPSD